MSAPIGYSAPPLVPAAGVPDGDADILALIEEEQRRQEEERQRLMAQAQGQQQEATGLRRLGLVTGMGTNPLLQGFSAKALGQAGALDANAARTATQVPQSGRFGQQVALARLRSAIKPPSTAMAALSNDPGSDASQRIRTQVRALYPELPEEVLATITERNGQPFLQRKEGTSRIGLQQEKNDQDVAQFSEMMGFRWASLNQAQRLAMARLMDTQAARTTKKETTLAERNVGGWTFDPANPPSADAAKKMADASIARDEIIASLNNLERLYNASGSEIIGARAGEMESEWMNVTNRLRVLNEMGVPNGGDYLMLAKQVEDPTELRNIVTSKGRGLAKMKTLRDQISRRMAATAKALKYRPDSAPEKGAKPRASAPVQSDQSPATAPTLDLESPASIPPAPRVPSVETLSKDRKWKRITYTDGTTETVPNG